jgi:L-lactate dehydrogenase
LGKHVGVDSRNVHAYIIGEHGDTEVAAWSMTNIAGIPMKRYCKQCHICEGNLSRYDIYQDVKNAAYKIIERKGSTYYAIALAVRRIVEAIVRDENSILTVSSLLNGHNGLYDVCLSLPTVVNRNGIQQVLDLSLDEKEVDYLKKSADSLKSVIKNLKLD